MADNKIYHESILFNKDQSMQGSDGVNHKITNLGYPTNVNDAATKDYVDTHGGGGGGGSQIYTGAGAPVTLHNNGDLYINTSNGDLYQQASGSWGSPIENIKGPTGAAGANGTNGAVWYEGAGAPVTLHNNGDFYLDSTTANMYEQIAGVWTLVVNFPSIYLPLAGGTMSGAIDMGTHQIHNVVDPTSAQDAATKNYVDTHAGNTLTNSGTRGSPNAITAVGGITAGTSVIQAQFVVGSGGPITVTANPQISAGTTIGQQMVLTGTDDTNTVTLSDGTGLELNGLIVLRNGSKMTLMWDGSKWGEVSRNGI